MRVLDLFAGLGGWSQAFAERGHEVITSDIDPCFGCTVTGDILSPQTRYEIGELGPYDIILASPPCETFSVAAMGHHWTGGKGAFIPATEQAKIGIEIAKMTFDLVQVLKREAWIVENPVGALRKMPFAQPYARTTVTYCRYGERNRKPTDLWLGGAATGFMFRPPCSNGSDCHDAAPRGSKTGTQGIKGASNRAKVPYLLSLEVCEQMEEVLCPTTSSNP